MQSHALKWQASAGLLSLANRFACALEADPAQDNRAPAASPTHPLNAPSQELLRSAQIALQRQKLVTQVNGILRGGCAVRAWSLIPPEVWEGPQGRFIAMACDFHAASLANTMLLAETPRCAASLNLPLYPIRVRQMLVIEAGARVNSLFQTFCTDHNRARMALDAGDLTALDDCVRRNHGYRVALTAIAHDLGAELFGQPAWERHSRMFGTALGWTQKPMRHFNSG